MSRRLQRLNVLLRREVADLLRRQLRDPRLAEIVTVTRADVSPDLALARVYISVLGDAEAKASTLRALTAAAPFMRFHLKSRLTIRRIPNLQFLLDESMEEAAHILEIMKQIPGAKP